MLQQVLLGAALVLALVWNLAHAGQIRRIALSEGPTGTRAEILLDAPVAFSTLRLSGPERLVVDLPGTPLRTALPAGTGVVKGVRSGQPAPGTTRIVFDLAMPVVPIGPRVESGAEGHRLVIEWPGDGAVPAAVPSAGVATTPAPPGDPAVPRSAPADPETAAATAAALERLIATLPSPLPASAQPAPASTASAPLAATPSPSGTGAPAAVPPPAGATKTAQQIMRGGMRPLIIAIDAGHGGQDPGARGPSGAREKDITLAIARELARQVDATPGLKAFLTRDSDVFIPLAQRYQKARAAKADLFVSIHADAFTNPEASGSSVFVLSPRGASSQAARWLANQENAADLVGGVRLHDKDDTLASVLLDLSQSATMKASEDIANHVLSGLKRLGKTHKPHVERANFVVLRAPDVPSMLVETAFITNPEEERRLKDPKHQQALARAILDGVHTYFSRQPPPGTLYAARAEAAAAATAATGAGGAP